MVESPDRRTVELLELDRPAAGNFESQAMTRARPALVLLGVAVLAYALLIPQMGFYWDELPMSWIRYELGPEAMTRYFSTNRPVWGLLYQVTTRLLPQIPIYWQVLALLTRWLTALCVWGIVRALWPALERMALIVALLFLIYPGFNQQWTAYLYSHFFIVLGFLLLSFLCTLRALQATAAKRRWLLTTAALLLSALNLWMMEYFFVLELLRPFLILHVVNTLAPGQPLTARLRRMGVIWAPYLAVFAANVLWRLFIFNNQIYQPTLLTKLRGAPLAAAWALVLTVLRNAYDVSVVAWAQALGFSAVAPAGPRTLLLYAAVLAGAGLLAAWALTRTRAEEPTGTRAGLASIALGVVAILLAGVPFWLTGLEITLGHPANRFTLPFMLGVSLLLGGLLEMLPVRARVAIATVLVALAAGSQALWSDAFRRDWSMQKALFWQMYWRAPGIQPGTMVLLNEGPLKFYADNSLTGALNWIYDPDNRSGSMDYVLFYPTSRLGGTLRDLSAGEPIHYDFISEVFTGSTSQTLAFYYSPPGCLRLLDPQIDAENRLIADDSRMREAARLSSAAWITAGSSAQMPAIYGPEPAQGWCYYFERASLAAQSDDWGQVAKLGDVAVQLADHPNDPVERFVFVEGYAHVGEWSRAEDLARQSYRVSPRVVGPLLCKLIARMDREIPSSNLKQSSLNDLRTEFSCLP